MFVLIHLHSLPVWAEISLISWKSERLPNARPNIGTLSGLLAFTFRLMLALIVSPTVAWPSVRNQIMGAMFSSSRPDSPVRPTCVKAFRRAELMLVLPLVVIR